MFVDHCLVTCRTHCGALQLATPFCIAHMSVLARTTQMGGLPRNGEGFWYAEHHKYSRAGVNATLLWSGPVLELLQNTEDLQICNESSMFSL